jgi:hypothetical protein
MPFTALNRGTFTSFLIAEFAPVRSQNDSLGITALSGDALPWPLRVRQPCGWPILGNHGILAGRNDFILAERDSFNYNLIRSQMRKTTTKLTPSL